MIGAPSLSTNQKRESGPPFSAASANNGLSVDTASGKIVLGNDQGAPGDPAQLLSIREIQVNSFGLSLHQGLFNAGSPAIFGAMLDGNIGGPFHCFSAEVINQPNGTILYRGTQDTAGSIGAIIQLECPNDQSVIEIASWGTNAGLPAFRKQTGGILSINAAQPDLLFQAALKGAPGSRPGRILFATSNLAGTETLTYSFLLPVLANLDFPNTLAQTSSDLTINVPGAADGDSVNLGVPIASQVANTCYTAFVSAVDTVTVRFNNYSAAAVNPAAGNFKVAVIKLL